MLQEFLVPITEEVSVSSALVFFLLNIKYPLKKVDKILSDTIEKVYMRYRSSFLKMTPKEIEHVVNVLSCQEYWRLLLEDDNEV